MSVKTTGVAAHDAVCNAAELVRQNEIAAAGNNQSQAIAADIKFHRAVIALARSNNMYADVAVANQALRSLGVWT